MMIDGGATSYVFDVLELTVFSQGVAMIAEEMGTLLERSAISPNIRERRDASCALFDADGRMVAQAAHIPVHLGAMPESVAAVRARGAQPRDLFLLNDPSHGGSHLPDLTMVEVIADPDDASRISLRERSIAASAVAGVTWILPKASAIMVSDVGPQLALS